MVIVARLVVVIVIVIVQELQRDSGRLQGQTVAEELAKERHFVRSDGNIMTPGASLDPRYLAAEFLLGMMLRKNQVGVLDTFTRGEGEACVHQMLMGGGKTCVIAPLAAAFLATPKRLFVAVVPSSLLAFSRQQLRARLGSPALGLPVLTFAFGRSNAVGPELLERLLHARRRRSAVCAAPQSVKSLLLRAAELASPRTPADRGVPTNVARRLLHAVGIGGSHGEVPQSPVTDASLEGARAAALRIVREALSVLHGSVVLVDEIDWVMHPLKSELHWPCGPVRPLDLAEATVTSEPGLRWRIMGALLEAFHAPGSQVERLLRLAADEHRAVLRPQPLVLDRGWYFRVLLPALAKELAGFLAPRTPVPLQELLEFLGPAGRCGGTLRRLPDAETKLVTLGRQLLHFVLPHLVGLQHRVRYGLLPDEDAAAAASGRLPSGRSARRQLLAVPFLGKDCPAKASEFAHPDVAIGLTVLSYRYEGLRLRDFTLLLRVLRAEMEEERGPHARRPTCLRWVSYNN